MRTASPRPVRDIGRTHLHYLLRQSQHGMGMRIMWGHPATTERQCPGPALVQHLPRYHDGNLYRDTLITLEVDLRVLPTTTQSRTPLAGWTRLHAVRA